jgi:glycerol dehydrogenase-like iron-containing ADH family enzyme
MLTNTSLLGQQDPAASAIHRQHNELTKISPEHRHHHVV